MLIASNKIGVLFGRLTHSFCTLPTLTVKNIPQLTKNWWSVSPIQQQTLKIPVFNAKTDAYSHNVVLDSKVFNVPIRKDLVYKLVDWRRNLDKVSTKITLTKGTVAGSGKKPHAQKKSGRARAGNKRAPGRRKGGKAHGPKPTIYSYPLNSKVKLLGMKSLLTSKLTEGRIKVVDKLSVQQGKTKQIDKFQVMKQINNGIRVYVVLKEVSEAFVRASSNTPLSYELVHNINVLDIVNADIILFTEQAILELQASLLQTQQQLYMQKHMRRRVRSAASPLEGQAMKLPIFQEYKQLLVKMKTENPSGFERQMKKIVKSQS